MYVVLYSEEKLAVYYNEIILMSWPDYIQNYFFFFHLYV